MRQKLIRRASLWLGAAVMLVAQTAPVAAKPRAVAAFSDACAITHWPPRSADEKGFGALLAIFGPIILPRLFNRGVDFASNRLRDAAGRAQIVKIAQTNGYFLEADINAGAYKGHRDLKCLIFAYGEMADASGEARLSEKWASRREALDDAGIRLGADPAFYYEGIVHFSDDGQSFKVRSVHIDYHRTLSGRTPRRNAERELAMSLVFKDGAGQAFAEGAIPLNAMTPGTVLDAAALGISLEEITEESELEANASPEFETAWMPALTPDEASIETLLRYCEEKACPNEENDKLQARPFSMQMQVTESSDTSAILNFLADTLQVSKPITSSLLTSQVLGKDVYDPFNPEWVERREAAYNACIALKNSRGGYQTLLTDKTEAQSVGLPFDGREISRLNGEVKSAFRSARAAYTAAGLPAATLYADSILDCRIVFGN